MREFSRLLHSKRKEQPPMGLFAHLIGVVDAANVLVGKATLLMLGIALFFKAATKATDAYWCFRKSLRKHKKSRPKNDQKKK